MAEGCNQGYNQNDKVTTKNEGEGCNQIWLKRGEVEKLLGVSRQAIAKAIKKGKFLVKESYGNGGRQYLIALSSLPPHGQIKWLKENLSQAKELPIDVAKKLHPEARSALARMIAEEKEQMEDYYMVEGDDIQEVDKRAYAVREYLLDPRYKTAERLGRELNVHPSTIYRWVEAAKEAKNKVTFTVDDTPIPVIMPRTKVPHDIILESLNIILAHQKARLSQGYEYIKDKGYDLSYSQYTRILNEMKPSFEKILKYHRSGRIAALLNDTPKIIRAWTKLPVMHTIVGDQHYMDYYFYSEELDEVVKFTLYIWMDCSSRYICSCVPAIGNYTQWHVQASLMEAFRIHTPSEIYTDWGKQETSKATEELIARLGTGHITIASYEDFIDRYPDAKLSRKRSTPGVPPVKPIENGIRRLTEFLNQKGIPGYMRRDMQDPFRNKAIQDELKKGRLLTVEQGMQALIDAIRECNNTEMRTEEGKVFVPSEFLWSGLNGIRVVWAEEDLVMMLYPRFRRKVRNASVQITISDKKIVFTAKELAWLRDKEEVIIFVNPFPPHKGSMIFREKGDRLEYLCSPDVWIGYGVDPQQQAILERAMEIKYGYLRSFVNALREIHSYKPEPVQRIGEVSVLTREVKQVAEIKAFPEIKKKEDWAKKNWQALGKLAEKLGY